MIKAIHFKNLEYVASDIPGVVFRGFPEFCYYFFDLPGAEVAATFHL